MSDPSRWPSKDLLGFDGHQPVGHLAKDVRRRIALNFLVLDPVQKRGTGRAKCRVRDEMVDEGVGVQKDRCASGDIGKDHFSSAQGWLVGPRRYSRSL